MQELNKTGSSELTNTINEAEIRADMLYTYSTKNANNYMESRLNQLYNQNYETIHFLQANLVRSKARETELVAMSTFIAH